MEKLKKLYLHNSIVQFVVSYIMVLLVPLLICSFGAKIALNVVEKNVKKSNMTMLNHSKTIIETDLRLIRVTALQIANSDIIQEVAKDKGTKSPDYYIKAKEAIQRVTNILQYKGINLLKNVSIYFENSNYLMLEKSMYEGTFYFTKVLKNDRLTMDDWKKGMLSAKSNGGYYRNVDGTLQFVQPIIGEDGQSIVGSVMCDIDMFQLNNLLSVGKGEIGESLFIQSLNNDEVIYEVNGEDNHINIKDLSFKGKQGTIDLRDKSVIYVFSELEDWRYILVVPEKKAMAPLHNLRTNEYFLILLATGIGMSLAFYASIRQGKPINEIFNIYIPDRDISRNFQNLGEIVSKIALNNKKLLNEMENEKPLIRNGFLNKLIGGEFVNETELKLLAEKAGCDITKSGYMVMAFRLFINNDFYEMDSQTMEEVRIISRLIQGSMNKYLKREIWFYEIDYLTTIAIFGEENPDYDVREVANFVRKEISEQYNIYPTWGTSDICIDLLELWRSCEEAKAALRSAKGQQGKFFVHYREIMEKQKGFYYPDLFEERLIRSVKSGDAYHIHKLIEISKKENFEVRKISRNMFLKLNIKFINTIARIKTSQDILKGIEQMNAFIIEYNNAPIEEYYNIVENIFIDLSTVVEENKRSKRSKLMTNIMEYIHENYMNSNFGLSMVATEFNISEAYVSTLFKEKTGINFASYVEKLRIDQSCILLKENSISVGEVAQRVGYNSIQSFRRAFKKVKGMNPSDMKNYYS